MSATSKNAATQAVDVGGTLFAYREVGPATGVPVVFLHHFTAMLDDWDPAVVDGIAAGSSNRYQNWETADPEKWVPDGYVCVRVDSRGAGRSPGYLDIFSAQETRDYYECIEWAGTQPWSNGKVGLLGISYYAISQWLVAALQPPHLAAICPWEGASDYYREFTHHGGILDTFVSVW
jgi:putative CocE/NonD family hydrolase